MAKKCALKKSLASCKVQIPIGATEGESLYEGHGLALGIYKAMMSLRQNNDIPEKKFKDFVYLREQTIEDFGEIWRSFLDDHILVTFVKDYALEKMEYSKLWYVVVTLEDPESETHSLLFGFPTTDEQLLNRHRVGERVQAEQVLQDFSH